MATFPAAGVSGPLRIHGLHSPEGSSPKGAQRQGCLRSSLWGRTNLPGLQRAAALPVSRRDAPRPVVSKMVVPDFGGKSPEARAADSLHNFFTYLAVRVVLAQLQAYNPEGYQELREFTDTVPGGLKDGDKFCAALMRASPRHKQLAMRIMEVRAAYCNEDFEWDNLRALSIQKSEDANKNLMCEFVMETTRFD